MGSADPQGYVHSVETAGAVDGPGVRFVVFLTGCPLSCAYCHNPDASKLKNGRLTSARVVLDEIAGYADSLRRMGGGVTISGGEPLSQPEFTAALLAGCRDMGLHTALDTSGYLGAAATPALLEACDLVLLDIKAGLPDLYRCVTGVALEPTLDFARRLVALGKPMWIRFVLVPGLTDGVDNLQAVAGIVRALPTVERLEVLPFHQMGAAKWQALDRAYSLAETRPPAPAAVESARALFRAEGIGMVC